MAHSPAILVVVDPTADSQPAVQRGATLAGRLDCPLALLICYYDTQLVSGLVLAKKKRVAVRRKILSGQLEYLESLARGLRSDGLEVAIKAVWDTPLSEGIVREVLRSEPRFVLKDTHHYSVLSRTILTNTDWQLIRDCPVPLWLVKHGELQSGTVLAAVDPMHEHEKPDGLDERILDEAISYAGHFGTELNVYHGYDLSPAIARSGTYTLSPAQLPIDEIRARVEATHRERFEQLMLMRAVDPAHGFLLPGPTAEVLPGLARRLDARLVVMGAIARGRLQHAIVGSTAERVLDQLPGDVLIVKPQRFESPVTYQPQAREFLELTP